MPTLLRLRNLGCLYLVFRLRLFLRYMRLVSRLDFTSCLSSTSPLKRTLSSEVIANPIFLDPVSTPMLHFCFVSPVAYVSFIVKGLYRWIIAFPSLRSNLAFLCVHGINGSPCILSTNTLIVLLLTATRKCCPFLLESLLPFANVVNACRNRTHQVDHSYLTELLQSLHSCYELGYHS